MTDTNITAPTTESGLKNEERPIAYFITPTTLAFLADPFHVYHTDSGFWKDQAIVLKLLIGIKTYRKASRAFVYAGITHEQYYYFCDIHPHISVVIDRAKQAREVELMNRIDRAKDWRAAAYLLENEAPEDFGRNRGLVSPPGGSTTTLIAQDIKNEDGKIVVSKRFAEIVQHDRDTTN